MYVVDSLIMEFVFYPVPNNNYCVYQSSIHNDGSVIVINIVQEFGSTDTFEWYYNEDTDYIYLYIRSKDLRVIRKIRYIPKGTPYIGDIVNIQTPGSLTKINIVRV